MNSYHFAHIFTFYQWQAERLLRLHLDASKEMFLTELYDTLVSIDSNLRDIEVLANTLHHPTSGYNNNSPHIENRLRG